MTDFTKEYTDLDCAIDEVRTLSNGQSDAWRNGNVDDETVHCACLVLHEWIANLHQHAQFKKGSPVVEVRLSCQDRQVFCSVTDNSEGFELEPHLPDEDDDFESLPERGMGLRMIESCTDDFSYTPTENGLHCFEFTIPSDHDPWLNTLF